MGYERTLLLIHGDDRGAALAPWADALAGAFRLVRLDAEKGWRTLEERLRKAPRIELIVLGPGVSTGLAWRVWLWKRCRRPMTLFGGFVRPGPGRPLGSWLEAVMDFSLGSGPVAKDVPTISHRRDSHRWRAAPGAGPAEAGADLARFLTGRLTEEERSVLWVEEDLSLESPSTKHLVIAVPHLIAAGWHLRAWCLHVGPGLDPRVAVRRFPALSRRLGFLTPYWFWLLANAHGLGRRLLDGRPPARVVQTVGGAYLGADLAAIHFVNHVWLRRQLELGLTGWRSLLGWLWTLPAVLKDELQFRNPRCRLFLPVSDSIAGEVRRRCRRAAGVRVLPNSYDETRFSPEVRARWRAETRSRLGFDATEPVFCCASQGQSRRTGFGLAVEALDRLRRGGTPPAACRARFLVVGGHPPTLARLQTELDARHFPSWREWITFVGRQTEVERYLAAADAFLFPSYFEAFCLAEIEAGALGLPLLLTPHPGTEMILRPGENGLLLSYDPTELANQLAGFLSDGLPPFAASPGRGLDRATYGAELAAIYEPFAVPVGGPLPNKPSNP